MAAEKAKSIAVAVDGSASGWEAMKRAINMARLLELPLDVLHVIQLRKAGYFAFIDRHLQEDQEAYAKNVLAEAVQRAEKKGVEAHTHLLEGEKDPSGAIIDFLEQGQRREIPGDGSYGHGFVGRHSWAPPPSGWSGKWPAGPCRCPCWWCRPPSRRKSPSPAISHKPGRRPRLGGDSKRREGSR